MRTLVSFIALATLTTGCEPETVEDTGPSTQDLLEAIEDLEDQIDELEEPAEEPPVEVDEDPLCEFDVTLYSGVQSTYPTWLTVDLEFEETPHGLMFHLSLTADPCGGVLVDDMTWMLGTLDQMDIGWINLMNYGGVTGWYINEDDLVVGNSYPVYHHEDFLNDDMMVEQYPANEKHFGIYPENPRYIQAGKTVTFSWSVNYGEWAPVAAATGDYFYFQVKSLTWYPADGEWTWSRDTDGVLPATSNHQTLNPH